MIGRRTLVLLVVILAACSPAAPPRASSPLTTRTEVRSAPRALSTPAKRSSRPSPTLAPSPRSAALVWPVFDGDPARTGVDLAEHDVGPANVSRLTVLWCQQLPAVADSAPVYENGRLFFTLLDGSTIALDSQTGRLLWRATTTGPKFTTASPALDPSGRWVYAYGLDGFVHRYDTQTGRESVGQGWPIRVTTWPQDEKGSSALNLASGRLYVATSGYPSDGGHYVGHLVTIDLASGTSAIFNTLCQGIPRLLTIESSSPAYCSSIRAGIWSREGTVVDPTTGNVFLATGNGPWNGTTNWGDSVLELSPNGQTILELHPGGP